MKLVPLIVTIMATLTGCAAFINTPSENDATIHVQPASAAQNTIAQLPVIAENGSSLGIDARRYTVQWSNTGVGGAAQRVPDFIHVLAPRPTDRRPAQRHKNGVELWEDRTTDELPIAPRGISPGDTAADIHPLFIKFCKDPSRLTSDERQQFQALGGVRAIPASLADDCRFEK